MHLADALDILLNMLISLHIYPFYIGTISRSYYPFLSQRAIHFTELK